MPSTELPIPSPQPRLVTEGGDVLVAGWRCPSCLRPTAVAVAWCPRCRAGVEPARFGPGGAVWSSTVVRIAMPGKNGPFALAYLDLDAGPRLLVHVVQDEPHLVAVGSRLRLTASTDPASYLCAEECG